MKNTVNRKMKINEDYCMIGCIEENIRSLNEKISVLSDKYAKFTTLPNKLVNLIATKEILSDLEIESKIHLNDYVVEDCLKFIELYSLLKDNANALPGSICSIDGNAEDILSGVIETISSAEYVLNDDINDSIDNILEAGIYLGSFDEVYDFVMESSDENENENILLTLNINGTDVFIQKENKNHVEIVYSYLTELSATYEELRLLMKKIAKQICNK